MRCKFCGAVFHGEDLKYCPYCENDISDIIKNSAQDEDEDANLSEYERERRARTAPIVSPDIKWGELHFVLRKGRNGFCPADGSHYFVIVDEYYETEILSADKDVDAVIKLPYGEHVLKIRMFPWDDDKLENEATYARHDDVRFVVGDETPRIELEQGTLLRSAKIRIF